MTVYDLSSGINSLNAGINNYSNAVGAQSDSQAMAALGAKLKTGDYAGAAADAFAMGKPDVGLKLQDMANQRAQSAGAQAAVSGPNGMWGGADAPTSLNGALTGAAPAAGQSATAQPSPAPSAQAGSPKIISTPTGALNLDAAKASIAGIESAGSGGYTAVGPKQPNGDVGLGKYQVMASNVPTWTKQALGQPMTPEQFLANPDAQEKVFETIFGGYAQQYGHAGAANAWFTGSPNPKPAAADSNGTTAGDYANRFLKGYVTAGRAMQGQQQAASGQAPGPAAPVASAGGAPAPGAAQGADQGVAAAGAPMTSAQASGATYQAAPAAPAQVASANPGFAPQTPAAAAPAAAKPNASAFQSAAPGDVDDEDASGRLDMSDPKNLGWARANAAKFGYQEDPKKAGEFMPTAGGSPSLTAAPPGADPAQHQQMVAQIASSPANPQATPQLAQQASGAILAKLPPGDPRRVAYLQGMALKYAQVPAVAAVFTNQLKIEQDAAAPTSGMKEYAFAQSPAGGGFTGTYQEWNDRQKDPTTFKPIGADDAKAYPGAVAMDSHGKPFYPPAEVAKTPQQLYDARLPVAQKLGLQPGTQAYQAYLAEGKIPGVNLNPTQLKIQDASNASLAALDENIGTVQNAIDQAKAGKMNFGLSGRLQQAWSVMPSILGGGSDSAANTAALDSDIQNTILGNLRTIFGGQVRVAEMTKAMSLKPSANQSQAEFLAKAQDYVTHLKNLQANEQNKSAAIANGSYFQVGNQGAGGPNAPGAPVPVPPGSARDQAQAPAAPVAPSIAEGATATNKATGQRVIFKGGQWTPLQ